MELYVHQKAYPSVENFGVFMSSWREKFRLKPVVFTWKEWIVLRGLMQLILEVFGGSVEWFYEKE